jgi:predicted dehydrogenase
MYWIIGSGKMAEDYLKVFQALEVPCKVIGRSENSSAAFTGRTGFPVIEGGFSSFLKTKPDMPAGVIIAVNVEDLYECCLTAIGAGIKKILVEKPAALFLQEVKQLNKIVKEKKIDFFIGYNRRFFASVIKLKLQIEEDGGLDSILFEFTEWSHVIEKLPKSVLSLSTLFFNNSTHVIDLAFFLAGKPKELSSFTGGAGHIPWHPKASIFAGAGITDKNILFSYTANWESAGRWGIELCTKKGRYYLRPMEELSFQFRGKLDLQKLEFDNSFETEFKHGLYLQTKSFLNGKYENMCSIEEHTQNFEYYVKMLEGQNLK